MIPNVRRITLGAACLALALALAAGGCAKKFSVLRYPDFYDPNLKSIAVLKFDNETLAPAAGEYVAKRLARALKLNGTYPQVLGPDELAAALGAVYPKLYAQPLGQAAAPVLRRLDNVQAFVVGAVTSFSAATYVELAPDSGYYHYGYGPGWRYGPRYGYYAGGYQSYTNRNVAMAAATARLVRIADEEILEGSPRAAIGTFRASGTPPKFSPEACLVAATDRVVRELLGRLAVVEVEVKVGPGELKTARGRSRDKWDLTGDFHDDEETMYVVLKLPRECARNEFRVAVGKKDGPDLASQNFVWQRGESPEGRGFDFSPARLAGFAGAGEYQARFYSSKRLVYQRGFEIHRPKGAPARPPASSSQPAATTQEAPTTGPSN